MAFRDVPLPPCISAGSEGAPVWMVDIARSPAGVEQRVGRRSQSLRRFNVGYQIRRLQDLYDVMAHFEVMNGPMHSFPLHDPLDNQSSAPGDAVSSADAFLGTGDGVTAVYPLYKQYTRGNWSHSRRIALPTPDTLLVQVNSVLKVEDTDYTVDYETGRITFLGGDIPANGHIVRAGFQYRCKVRFDTNDLAQVYEGFRVGGIPNIPLIEVDADEASEESGS